MKYVYCDKNQVQHTSKLGTRGKPLKQTLLSSMGLDPVVSTWENYFSISYMYKCVIDEVTLHMHTLYGPRDQSIIKAPYPNPSLEHPPWGQIVNSRPVTLPSQLRIFSKSEIRDRMSTLRIWVRVHVESVSVA